jgi:NAD(P)-dependent dehydrogenase (short-subunit alcohol dehydrogenase family)
VTTIKEKPIGFTGLGAMGSRMAQRLLAAGYRLTVYNRTRAKAEALAANGVAIAETPRALATGCDYIMICLTDDAAPGRYLGSLIEARGWPIASHRKFTDFREHSCSRANGLIAPYSKISFSFAGMAVAPFHECQSRQSCALRWR